MPLALLLLPHIYIIVREVLIRPISLAAEIVDKLAHLHHFAEVGKCRRLTIDKPHNLRIFRRITVETFHNINILRDSIV